MQSICALFGHQPAPLRTRRRAGRQHNRCVLCQRAVERPLGGGTWTLTERKEADRLTG